MRELKFRTWNWLEGRYDKNPCALLTISGELTPSVNRIIEQYTGLKDKNGKEIYEGDIVRFRTVYQGKYLEGVGGVSMCELPDSDGWENDGYLCWAIDGYISLSCADTEAIGNIHENPELLEKEE